MKKHLLGGVKKGAFTAVEADKKFDAWMKNKQVAVAKVKEKLASDASMTAKQRLDAEKAANKAKAAEVAKKQAEKYAKMSFSDFANFLGEVIKETGKQGATALIYAISGVVGASAFFSFFIGIYYGDIPQIIISIIFFGLSILGFRFTSKRYKS